MSACVSLPQLVQQLVQRLIAHAQSLDIQVLRKNTNLDTHILCLAQLSQNMNRAGQIQLGKQQIISLKSRM